MFMKKFAFLSWQKFLSQKSKRFAGNPNSKLIIAKISTFEMKNLEGTVGDQQWWFQDGIGRDHP